MNVRFHCECGYKGDGKMQLFAWQIRCPKCKRVYDFSDGQEGKLVSEEPEKSEDGASADREGVKE